MLTFRIPDWVRGKRADADEASPAFVERRADVRHAVFREAVLTLEGYYRIRAVIIDVSAGGVGIKYTTRLDLPSRLIVTAPMLKLHRWARVVWQHDGRAGLDLQQDA